MTLKLVLALASSVLLAAACAPRPEGVWDGQCTGTRDDDGSAYEMGFGIQIVREDQAPTEAGELPGSEGSLRLIGLERVRLVPPAGEGEQGTGEFRTFQVPNITVCESPTCTLGGVEPDRAPFNELAGSEGVSGDAWVEAIPTNSVSADAGTLVAHFILFFGHFSGETFTGDLLWESVIEGASGSTVEDRTRVGRGPCTLQHEPQGFFDDYNEL